MTTSKIFIFSFLVALIGLQFSGKSQSSKKFSDDILKNPQKYSKEFERLFNYNEVYVFEETGHPENVLLENGYTKSKIINPERWKPYDEKIVITQIDIVFTKYPRDKEFWRTNYYDLLAARVRELIALDSSLNSSDFEWNLVLQTKPVTEPEAKSMFHGISITYFKISDYLREDDAEVDETPIQDTSYFIRNELKVKNFIRSQGGSNDSIVFKVFDRNRNWQNALVVMDWTGSMYQYGAQAVLWHTLNFETSGIRNFVFFNDGDQTPDERKEIGKTGGVYFAQAKNLERLVNTFYLVGKRGKGGDIPENDVEALIKGMNRFEDFDELILIADNNSCMRDFRLLANLDVKVNVIVCGANGGINPQYVNLAYYTGGSIHTMEADIKHLSSFVKNKELTIDNLTYKLGEEDLFGMKYQRDALKYKSCDEFTTLEPLTPDPRLAFIVKNGGITDSTIYKVLERHPLWQNLIVVMDWTQEACVNSAQAVLWHKVHQKTSGIDYFVFFNDGNKTPDKKKKSGRTGGIYYQKSNNLRQVEKRFDYVSKRSQQSREPANNDLEALMAAANKFTKTDNFVLLADNRTCVRDMDLLKFLNLPIKVVLSNIEGPINPQYINLAYKSGGSLHIMEDDIYNYVFTAMAESDQILVLKGYEYVLNDDGLFELKDKSIKTPCAKYNQKEWWKKIFRR
ncbi:MAG: hypothetical protein JXR34_03885 [Bacteroidales bacterium]|nr:hypothetical protein [Bacteroidales bacterium]